MMKAQLVLKNFVLLFCTLSLMSCSLLGPVKTKPVTSYTLRGVEYQPSNQHVTNKTILVNAPNVVQAFNTNQMAYSIRRYQIGYYAQNQWIATPPQMLEPLLVKSLHNTHFFRAVVSPPFLGRYSYILNTQILDFIQDFTTCPATARMSLSVELIRSVDNRVIASRQFTVYEPLARPTAYCGVAAMNRGTVVMLEEITQFVTNSINSRISKR